MTGQEETLEEKLSHCITMLYTHGIITSKERDAARKRLMKMTT